MRQESEIPPDAEATVDTLQDRIDTALRASLDEQWTEVLDQWSSATPAEREAVRADVSRLRDRILDSLLTLDSRSELKRGLAVGYVEVKCHWTMLNMQIQRQTATDGRPAEPLIYRATCVSLIVQALEPLLSRESMDRITDFLAEPLA